MSIILQNPLVSLAKAKFSCYDIFSINDLKFYILQQISFAKAICLVERMVVLKLTYVNPSLAYNIQSIMGFFPEGEEVSSYWQTPLFHFFPALQQSRFTALNEKEKKIAYMKF